MYNDEFKKRNLH